MKKTLKVFLIFIILQSFILVFYKIGFISPIIFMIFICVLYIAALPRYLLSPQNIIFVYYFLWYGLAPAFATRFQSYSFKSEEELLAYLLLFFTFGLSMVVLHFWESYFTGREKVEHNDYFHFDKNKIKKIIIISGIIMFVSLILFVNNTGGISYWIQNSKMAFLTRQGTGALYLLFTHSLMIFSFAIGVLFYKRGNKLVFILFLSLIILLYPFIGSKAKVILILFIFLVLHLINKMVISKWTIITTSFSIILFLIGIYQRNNTWMTIKDIIPYSLNYFNTFEMFVILLKDFEPSFLKTFFLPFNKILLYFGIYFSEPFYDMSAWLSSIYYPESWKIGATEQWPIEADLYMSFYFILGIPFLIVYLWWISYAFYMARKGYLSWMLIYIMEFVFIISHYRGGLSIWWYWYMVPFYLLVLIIFRKMKIKIKV